MGFFACCFRRRQSVIKHFAPAIVSGVLNNDNVSATYMTAATTASDVLAGGYPITLAGLTGSKAADYSASIAGSLVTPGTLTITPLTVNAIADNLSKVYGAAVSGLTRAPALTSTLPGVDSEIEPPWTNFTSLASASTSTLPGPSVTDPSLL